MTTRHHAMPMRTVLSAIVTCAVCSSVQAQPPGTPRPAYSPYLNLLRPGGSTTQNYYGLVRPEQDFRNSIGGLQSQIATSNQPSVDQFSGNSAFPTTGHRTAFMNYSHFYALRGRSSIGGGGGSPVAAPNAASPQSSRGGSSRGGSATQQTPTSRRG